MKFRLNLLKLIWLRKNIVVGNNTILIRADVDTKHGEILKLMKMARAQQIETMAMAVKDLSEEE